MITPPDPRPPVGVAFEWVSRILAVVVEMVVPGLGGVWLDDRWGCDPLFTLLGFALGLAAGIWTLIVMTKSPPSGLEKDGTRGSARRPGAKSWDDDRDQS